MALARSVTGSSVGTGPDLVWSTPTGTPPVRSQMLLNSMANMTCIRVIAATSTNPPRITTHSSTDPFSDTDSCPVASAQKDSKFSSRPVTPAACHSNTEAITRTAHKQMANNREIRPTACNDTRRTVHVCCG